MKTFPIVLVLVAIAVGALAALAGLGLWGHVFNVPARHVENVSPQLANGVNRWKIPQGDHLHEPGPNGTIHLPPLSWVQSAAPVRYYLHGGLVCVPDPFGQHWITRDQFFKDLDQSGAPYAWVTIQRIEKPR